MSMRTKFRFHENADPERRFVGMPLQHYNEARERITRKRKEISVYVTFIQGKEPKLALDFLCLVENVGVSWALHCMYAHES